MERRDTYRTMDCTLLLQDATQEETCQICDDAVVYGTVSVCIPPSYVKRASEYLGDRMPVCTVIGFPNGYSTTAVKVSEMEDAIKSGVAKIDVMINIGDLEDKNYGKVMDGVRQIKAACGEHVLRMIIGTCPLTDEKKVKMCQIVTKSDADYIKTFTGFSRVRATFEDIALFKEHVGEGVKVKAVGSISSFDDAERSIGLGAGRLSTSRIVKLARAEEEGYERQTAGTDGY